MDSAQSVISPPTIPPVTGISRGQPNSSFRLFPSVSLGDAAGMCSANVARSSVARYPALNE